jgi:cyanophycinase
MIAAFFVVFFALAVAFGAQPGFRDNYETWCIGKCNMDTLAPSLPGAVLMGGGTDTDEAFIWQIGNAKGGDFLVIRASGDDAYNQYIMDLSVANGTPLNSVTTLLCKNRDASSDSIVLNLVQNAEAIFFAGGDQNDYVEYFADTQVMSIINSKLGNVTVGGTSAGLAIQGNIIYTASDGSVDSDKAMADPYGKEMTFAPGMLQIPFMDTIITDTHFVTRNRMGRMLTFLARVVQDDVDITSSHAVGVDEHTALLLDVTTGDVTAVGVSTAYVCTGTHDPELCKSGVPLTYSAIACTRLNGRDKDTYSLKSFRATTGGVDYVNAVTAGHLTDFPYGPKDAKKI